MSKHTPGPWINDGDEISGLADGENSQSYIVPICTMDADWIPEITAANARLIAAAPDLLYIASWIEKEYEEGDGTIPDGLYNAARVAIKKATSA